MRTHDLIIIGSGSGNSIIGPEHDDMDVAIVERGLFGGTCLNVGCIPSKMLVYTAEIAELAAHVGPKLGIHTAFTGADNTVKLPTGISSYPKEIVRTPRSWAEKRYTNIQYWNDLDKGGHFAAFEQPELFVKEMRNWRRAIAD